MRDLNDFHEVLGAMPHEILELSVAVVSKFGTLNIEYAIELLDDIEVDTFKIDAAIELLKKTQTTMCINEIAKKIRILDDPRVQEFERELELVEIENQDASKKIICENYEAKR